MMRSMFSGVSGLKVHQTKMDVIGNNIANVNTSGFKSSRVTFNEMFNQTLAGASKDNPRTGRGGVNPMQIGLGVNIGTIDTIMTEGAAQRTDNPLDVKLEGDGFVIVKPNSASDQMYTRAGNLYLDSAGNLTAPGGGMVMGWMPNENGEVNPTEQIKTLNILQGKATIPAEATSDDIQNDDGGVYGVKIDGNINSATEIGNKISIPFTVYDSIGNPFEVAVYIEPQTVPGPPVSKVANAWQISKYTVTSKNGFVLDGTPGTTTPTKLDYDLATPIAVKFNTDGTLQQVGSTADVKYLNFQFKLAATATALPNTDAVLADGTTKIAAHTPAAAGSLLSGGAPLSFNIDLSKMTQYASGNSPKVNTTGNEPGSLSNFTVGSDGKITGIYSNGKQQTLGQLAVATFQNPAGLEKTGGNLFRATANSGQVSVHEAGAGGAGKFNGGVLEMSNVDLSKEFTEMITTQRGFQANSKIISTSDEMLQELVNLKR